MYAPFFGLKHEPFSIAPDPRFLYMSERHREALAHLLYGLRGGGGFVLLTGEIGAGKTTVCRCFLEQIPKRCNVAYIFNPKLTVEELLKSVCEEFRIPSEHEGPGSAVAKDHVDALNHFLLRTHAVGQNNVLIIDEAQNLSADVLEQLRLLTNLETNERKLLQIILIGQPELRSMLARPDLEQLAQRVIARYHLEALSEAETQQYISHRLGVAGMTRALPFDRQALHRIHRLTRGIPRRVNLVCDGALLGAYASGKPQIDRRIVDGAATEVFGAPPAPTRWARVGRRSVALGMGTGLVTGAALFSVVALALNGAWRKPPSAMPERAVAAAAKGTAPSASVPALRATASSTLAVGTLDWVRLLRSEKDAWRELAAAWHIDVPEGDPCAAAQQQQLQCFRSGGSSLALIRQLDRPAILTLYENSAGKPVYAVLIGLNEASATLRAGGATQTVALASLAGVWRGDVATLWRTPPGYDARSANVETPSLHEWLQDQLGKQVAHMPAQGAMQAEMTGDLKSRIAAFQLAQGLHPDGLAGPITFMQLNRIAGVEEPRLRH